MNEVIPYVPRSFNGITREQAQAELRKLVQRCRADVDRGKYVLDADYAPAGKEMIVNDYLLWARKLERHVDPRLYRSSIRNMLDCLKPADKKKGGKQ